MARIPPELVDMIVSKAYDNPPLLAVCGLVCRSWLASSRFHLLNGPVVLRPGNVNAFTQVLANPASTLPPYIRTLEISSGNLAGQSYDSQWLDPCIQVLADLPCVTEFLLENIHWGHMNPRTKTAILSGFQSLAHLEIRAAQFDSVLQVTQLVCSKPLLEILSFDDIAWKDPSFESPTTVPASLRSLRLSNCYKRDVLEWLVSHSSLPPIHHIQLGPVYPQDTVSIGRFLERLEANLFTLELEFSSLDAGGDAEDFCAHVDLSHNSALRTVLLDKFVHYSVYQFSSPIAWIPELVSRISSLCEMAFGVAIHAVEELQPEDDPIDWASLDSLFSHPERFPHLHALRFWVTGSVAMDEVADFVTHSLPLCSNRRLLYFHWGSPRLLD